MGRDYCIRSEPPFESFPDIRDLSGWVRDSAGEVVVYDVSRFIRGVGLDDVQGLGGASFTFEDHGVEFVVPSPECLRIPVELVR